MLCFLRENINGWLDLFSELLVVDAAFHSPQAMLVEPFLPALRSAADNDPKCVSTPDEFIQAFNARAPVCVSDELVGRIDSGSSVDEALSIHYEMRVASFFSGSDVLEKYLRMGYPEVRVMRFLAVKSRPVFLAYMLYHGILSCQAGQAELVCHTHDMQVRNCKHQLSHHVQELGWSTTINNVEGLASESNGVSMLMQVGYSLEYIDVGKVSMHGVQQCIVEFGFVASLTRCYVCPMQYARLFSCMMSVCHDN